jgi:TPR repeat protein
MGNKDYKEVSDFTKDLALAESGDAMGMIGVAHRYYNGIGVNIDRNKSFEWYNKAASIGSADGIWSLAKLFYLSGEVVVKDPVEGERMLQEAFRIFLNQANQGDAYSQNAVGNMLLQGEGVARSYEQALDWYRLGAGNGNIWSMYSLAEAYLYGRGVINDYDLAIEWLARFAEKGGPDECFRLDNIASKFRWGWDGVLLDHAKSMKLLRIGVSYGCASCYGTLGDYLHDGIATQRDESGALECWRKAAGLGNPHALIKLGDVYVAGLLVEKNLGMAARFYIQASELNSRMRCQVCLKLYRLGDFNSRFEAESILEATLKLKPDGYWERVQIDMLSLYYLAEFLLKEHIPAKPILAIRCYNKIIEIGGNFAPLAWKSLGFLYLNGVGVPRDYSESVRCFIKAAMLGDADACRELGFAYCLARGVISDHKEAYAWWNIARSLGDKKAEEEMSSVEAHLSQDQIKDAQARSSLLHNSMLESCDEANRKYSSD